MISIEFSIPPTPFKPVRVFNRFDELDEVRRNLGGLSEVMGGYKPTLFDSDETISPIPFSKSSHSIQYTPHTPTKVLTPMAPSKSSKSAFRFRALDTVRRNLFDLADVIGGFMGSPTSPIHSSHEHSTLIPPTPSTPSTSSTSTSSTSSTSSTQHSSIFSSHYSLSPLVPPTPRKRTQKDSGIDDEHVNENAEEYDDSSSHVSKKLFTVRWNI